MHKNRLKTTAKRLSPRKNVIWGYLLKLVQKTALTNHPQKITFSLILVGLFLANFKNTLI